MIGFDNLINPVYHPRLFIEEVDGKHILVLWVIGGTGRPYEVPEQITAKEKRSFYYIRQYANSIKANTEQTRELISLTNQVPFDDRPNRQARVDDISPVRIQDYLRISGSRLTDWIGQRPLPEILEQMALLEGPPEHLSLRNVALMLFSEHPDKFFPYTYLDLVHFPKGPANKQFIEKQFKGPVPEKGKELIGPFSTPTRFSLMDLALSTRRLQARSINYRLNSMGMPLMYRQSILKKLKSTNRSTLKILGKMFILFL